MLLYSFLIIIENVPSRDFIVLTGCLNPKLSVQSGLQEATLFGVPRRELAGISSWDTGP